MTDSTLETITKRLDRLERDVWRWKLAGSAALLLIFALLATAASPKVPDEVRAKKFIVVDDGGKPRIQLGEIEWEFVGSGLRDCILGT